jgi:hypothetical protein
MLIGDDRGSQEGGNSSIVIDGVARENSEVIKSSRGYSFRVASDV